MPEITPLTNMERRLPRAGKIRLGKKGDRGQPQKLGTFRFTSHDATAIRELASLYGGTAKEWKNSPNPDEWEVITEATSIPVVLPPGALYGPFYEQWTRSGLQRRCDGIECETLVDSPEGRVPTTIPCICSRKGNLECQQKLRISLLLRDIRFAGVWMLESSGWNALHELPGMVEMILNMQTRGLTTARLTLAQRSKVTDGKTFRFVVPELSLDTTLDQLATGAAALGEAHSTTMGLSGGGDPELALPPADPFDDNEIVDAEVVEETPPRSEPDQPAHDVDFERLTLMSSLANDHRIPLDVFVGAMIKWDESHPDRDVTEALEGLRDGTAVWRGLTKDGAARINRVPKR